MEVIQITEVPDENGVAQQQHQVSAENSIIYLFQNEFLDFCLTNIVK